jgi:hypothetical protein
MVRCHILDAARLNKLRNATIAMLAPHTTESPNPPRLNGSLTTPATAEITAICKTELASRSRKLSGPANMNSMTTRQATDTSIAAIEVDALVTGMVIREHT